MDTAQAFQQAPYMEQAAGVKRVRVLALDHSRDPDRANDHDQRLVRVKDKNEAWATEA
jgi:hypothetical protein